MNEYEIHLCFYGDVVLRVYYNIFFRSCIFLWYQEDRLISWGEVRL